MTLKAFRKKRRPGNKAMTKAERGRVTNAKTMLCVPCMVWHELGHLPREDVAVCCDYNHELHGSIRRGHFQGYAACLWHHRGHPGEGWDRTRMENWFGPSLAYGSKPFYEAYGDADTLIARQARILAEEQAL